LGRKRLVCFPNPAPSRNEAVAEFVQWAKARPQHMNELPVETEFRFLMEKWPCK
jgi:Rap1a immunity proteins